MRNKILFLIFIVSGLNAKKSRRDIVFYEKPYVVNKQELYNFQRRYYKPYYQKGSSRFSDPYWRKPYKSVSFGIDI